MFPVEIFEEILKHCDPVDLLRYKSVCSTWTSMIPRIIDQQPDMWYKKCLSDIPETMWSSMLDPGLIPGFDPIDYHKAKNHPSIWIRLWRSWIAWCKLLRTEVTTEMLEPLPELVFDERITCIAMQNNIIAVGSSQGYVTVFDIDNADIRGTIDFKRPIIDVHLFGTVDCIGVVASLINKQARLCTIINKDVINCSDCTEHGEWICNNLCKGYVTVLSPDFGVIKLTTLTTFRGEIVQTKLRSIPWMARTRLRQVAGIETYGDRILLFTEGRTHGIYSIREGEAPIRLTSKQPPVMIRRYYTFKPFVVACISAFGVLGFLYVNGFDESNEWKMYNLFKKLHAPVTAVLFHVGVLVLGLESGEVHVFHVKDGASLMDLDFDAMESMILRLDTEAIILLKGVEQDSVPHIIAATTRRVYFIKFTAS